MATTWCISSATTCRPRSPPARAPRPCSVPIRPIPGPSPAATPAASTADRLHRRRQPHRRHRQRYLPARAAASLTGKLDGGGGSNTLDYSSRSTRRQRQSGQRRRHRPQRRPQPCLQQSAKVHRQQARPAAPIYLYGPATATTYTLSTARRRQPQQRPELHRLRPSARQRQRYPGRPRAVQQLDPVQPQRRHAQRRRQSAWPSAASARCKGGSNTDVLTGPNTANTWLLTGHQRRHAHRGGVALTFSGMEGLRGGSGNDTFSADAGGSAVGLDQRRRRQRHPRLLQPQQRRRRQSGQRRRHRLNSGRSDAFLNVAELHRQQRDRRLDFLDGPARPPPTR